MQKNLSTTINQYLNKIRLPAPDSHKGQNGKLIIIGGSKLFHAASKWSLDVASKFVDMVFYSSVPQNNQIVKEAKGKFWNGIVVPRNKIENYIKEADCVLIGPGMERDQDTEKVVNYLLSKYPHKKWVIDAGALQMINPQLLNNNCIITPHEKELQRILKKLGVNDWQLPTSKSQSQNAFTILQNKIPATIILKGPVDHVITPRQIIPISGGNAGMTKGGTGDVLAGLVVALYCQHDATTAAVVGSYINKKAGDELYGQVGPYFNASDLVKKIPKTMWQEVKTQAI